MAPPDFLNHWHPVLKSSGLRKTPVKIRLNDTDIVLFRGEFDRIGALLDACPHRRMQLNLGCIKNDRLICPYHGYEYNISGEGKIPGSENRKIQARNFDAIERSGVIWIKNANVPAIFPFHEPDGYRRIALAHHKIKAPLPLVLDNFSEVEHTSQVHAFLGYDAEKMNEIEIKLETSENSVRLFNKGQQKKVPGIIRWSLNLGTSDYFIDDWTTFFSPIHAVYDQYWTDLNGNVRKDKLKVYVFFNSTVENQTELFTFLYMTTRPFGKFGLNLFIKPAMKIILNMEVQRDKKMIEQLAEKTPEIKGMKLSRFDQALVHIRNRIEKIYLRKENHSN